MQNKKFKIKFIEPWAKCFATEIGELKDNVLEIPIDTWNVINTVPTSHLAKRRNTLNSYAKVKEIRD